MTQVEKIKKDIQEMETALSMPSINDMPKVKKRLETDLKTARAELDSLQKKTESQLTGNTGQLPKTPIRDAAAQVPQETKKQVEEWANKVEKEQVQQNQRQEETVRAFEPKPILTAPQPKALTKLPAPTKPIKWANGDVKEMNELDLRRKSVDYFGDVLNGKRLPSDFYRSMQFNNLVRFQIGLYRFGNPIMAHTVLHPTYNMCEKKTQDRSLELFRQVHDMWSQYKDTDIV